MEAGWLAGAGIAIGLACSVGAATLAKGNAVRREDVYWASRRCSQVICRLGGRHSWTPWKHFARNRRGVEYNL
jgi:hypothetical protein